MPENFYKEGNSFFTTGGRRVSNPAELDRLSRAGGIEVPKASPVLAPPTPVVPTPVASTTGAVRPGAYGASDWRSYQALKDAGEKIIGMRNNQNKDLNTAQTLFDSSFKDTTPFGGPRAPGAPNISSYLDNPNFRELSPSDQASLRASQQGVALANLQTIGDERAYRQRQSGSALSNIEDIYRLQQTAKDRETDNARQARAQENADVKAGRGYINSAGQYVDGTPPNMGEFTWDSFSTMIGDPRVTQGFDASADYIQGREIHGGYDFAIPIGTPVPSPVQGTVKKVVTGQDDAKTGWGNYVIVEDDQGNNWRLSHLSQVNVNEGDRVGDTFVQGESRLGGGQIGLSGNTGRSTGPHLHFEVKDKNGNLIDPKNVGGTTAVGNKLTATQTTSIITRGNAAGLNLDVASVRKMSPQQIADVESVIKAGTSDTEKTILSAVKKIPANTLVRLQKKFGDNDGIALILNHYYNEGEEAARATALSVPGVTAQDYEDLINAILDTE